MTDEQQPREHPQDPAEGADTEQRSTEDEPQRHAQDPAEGADDPATTEGDA
ncbi:MAG TPA: hypothetical protein VFG72_08885 [Marmoricola sp.]|nr:hypothetical protein [Marmoricola sp.]